MEEIDSFKTLLALLCAIDWLANDLHYRSEGIEFYEKHLLADRIRDFGDAEDQLKEAYYLGFKEQLPPYDKKIAVVATALYNSIQAESGDFLYELKGAFCLLQQVIDTCKKEPNLPAGVHAILDSISEKALTYKFLVQRQLAEIKWPERTAIHQADEVTDAQQATIA